MQDTQMTQSSHDLLRRIAELDPESPPQAVVDIFGTDQLHITDTVRADGTPIRCIHLDGMIDDLEWQNSTLPRITASSGALQLCLPTARLATTVGEAQYALLHGCVMISDAQGTVTYKLPGMPDREVDEPSTERAVFGAKEAFIESLEKNITLVRRHLRDPRLRVQRLSLGRDARTAVAVLAISGVAQDTVVADVIRRLRTNDQERVGFISALLTPLYGISWSPFVKADFSERPDRTADQLCRGRVAILMDGSPFAMVVPQTFTDIFRGEESEQHAIATHTFVRTLRMLAFYLAVLAPGMYVAVLSVNTAVLPGLLAIAVAASRLPIAYPLFTETLVMLVMMDIMAEATVSMKGVLGPAISIVGSLIIGQAAVRASLASNLAVILISLTALSTFVTPRYYVTYAYRIWKYPILIVSGMFGITGWTIGLLMLAIHLISMRSIGIPYTVPVAPFRPHQALAQSALSSISETDPDFYRRAEDEWR